MHACTDGAARDSDIWRVSEDDARGKKNRERCYEENKDEVGKREHNLFFVEENNEGACEAAPSHVPYVLVG